MPRIEHPLRKNESLPASLRSRKGWSEMFELKRPAEPHVHQIEPTNHCPYACIMCPRSHKMTRGLGFMEMDLYYKLIDEIAQYSVETREKEIELFHFGESLLHPKIDEMVGYASDRDIKIVLSVNAPHLQRELAERILERKPYKITISLDGSDEKSYRKIRGPVANFDKALKNINSLIQIHKKLNSRTELIARMIELNDNKHQRSDFRNLFKSLNIKVEFQSFFPWTESELAELGTYQAYPVNMPCPFPWEYLVVQWHGTIVPCCRDYNSFNVMGNVKDTSLKEIWNSREYAAFRAQHACGNFADNEFCKDCMSIYGTE